MSDKVGIRHLIQCHCVLPQYRDRSDPVFHKFVVFSIQEGDSIVPKLSRCNNCGVIHKIVDICKSEMIHGMEDTESIITKEDVRHQLSEKIVNVLEKNFCEVSVWENISFLIENEKWNNRVVISKNEISDSVQYKTLTIIDSDKFKIESHLVKSDIEGGFQIK
jgi:hypothetical protein